MFKDKNVIIVNYKYNSFHLKCGSLCPFVSLELCTLFSIVQCRIPGVTSHSWIQPAGHGLFVMDQ